MRSKVVIASLVALVALGAGAAMAIPIVVWGVRGLIVVAITFASVLVVYLAFVRRWIGTWGATEDEVVARMPGDEVIPGARAATRAITIDAPPAAVWPWLVQIGYGRAGWYSYDWIDNDGTPSARRIVPELQALRVGDEITMIPGMGPRVRSIDPERVLLSGDATIGTWCVELRALDGGRSRLVSRWRAKWKMTPAAFFWIAITEPGSFIMERKMLRGIKARAEHLARVEPAARAA